MDLPREYHDFITRIEEIAAQQLANDANFLKAYKSAEQTGDWKLAGTLFHSKAKQVGLGLKPEFQKLFPGQGIDFELSLVGGNSRLDIIIHHGDIEFEYDYKTTVKSAISRGAADIEMPKHRSDIMTDRPAVKTIIQIAGTWKRTVAAAIRKAKQPSATIPKTMGKEASTAVHPVEVAAAPSHAVTSPTQEPATPEPPNAAKVGPPHVQPPKTNVPTGPNPLEPAGKPPMAGAAPATEAGLSSAVEPAVSGTGTETIKPSLQMEPSLPQGSPPAPKPVKPSSPITGVAKVPQSVSAVEPGGTKAMLPAAAKAASQEATVKPGPGPQALKITQPSAPSTVAEPPAAAPVPPVSKPSAAPAPVPPAAAPVAPVSKPSAAPGPAAAVRAGKSPRQALPRVDPVSTVEACNAVFDLLEPLLWDYLKPEDFDQNFEEAYRRKIEALGPDIKKGLDANENRIRELRSTGATVYAHIFLRLESFTNPEGVGHLSAVPEPYVEHVVVSTEKSPPMREPALRDWAVGFVRQVLVGHVAYSTLTMELSSP